MRANTAASTATPRTPPSSRIALFAPDACPSAAGATDERTTFATGAKKSPIPMPESANGATRSTYGVVGVETAAIHARPAAWSARPAPMNRWPPIRSESAPAIGATTIGIAVHGRMRSPEPSGE